MTAFTESMRRHFLPKKAKQPPRLESSVSWWLPQPGESQYSTSYQRRFMQAVAEKQAELQRSHFGTLASMIHGPEEQRIAKPKERAL